MIGIGYDHGGFELKGEVIKYLEEHNIEYKDFGTYSDESTDYPIYGKKVANAVVSGECEKGILICGTGIGMSIAVNRFAFIRGALVFTPEMAALARRHNNANVLILGGRTTDLATAAACVETFLTTEFEGGRHARRVAKMEVINNE